MTDRDNIGNDPDKNFIFNTKLNQSISGKRTDKAVWTKFNEKILQIEKDIVTTTKNANKGWVK